MQTLNAVAFSMCYLFFSFGLNGSDLGLPPFITFNRLGYVFVTIMLLLHALRFSQPQKIFVGKADKAILRIMYMMIVWSCISIIVTPYPHQASVGKLVELCLLLYVVITTMILLSEIDLKWINSFFGSLMIINTIMLVATFVYLVRTIGVAGLNNLYLIRNSFSNVSIGLNRYITGLVFSSVSSLAFAFRVVEGGKTQRVLSVLNSIALFFFTVISGSRQNVISILGIIFLTSTMLRRTTTWRRNKVMLGGSSKRTLVLFVLLIMCVTLYLDSKGIELVDMLKARFITTTVQKKSEIGVVDPRITIIRNATVKIKKRPFFGHGIGSFFSFNGIQPHNAFLNIAFELGLIPVAILLLSAFFIMMKGFRPGQIVDVQWVGIYTVSFSFFIVGFFVSNIFNDLFYTKSLWIMLILSNRASKQAFF